MNRNLFFDFTLLFIVDFTNKQLRGKVSCSPIRAICKRRYLVNECPLRGARELSTVTFATKRKRARFGNRKPCLAASGKTTVNSNNALFYPVAIAVLLLALLLLLSFYRKPP